MNHALTCSCGHNATEHPSTIEGDTYAKVVAMAQAAGEISLTLIQQRHGLGYGMAQRILKRMETEGLAVAPAPGGCWQLAPGNGTMAATDTCIWQLTEGKAATYATSCGRTMMASEPPEEGEECLNCDKPVTVRPKD